MDDDEEIENILEIIIAKIIEDEGVIKEKDLKRRIKEIVMDEIIEEN